MMRLRRDEGIALITALLLIITVLAFALVIMAVSNHSTEMSALDHSREDAFHAADAGMNDTLRCLSGLFPYPAPQPVAGTCPDPAHGTLTDKGTTIGTYDVTASEPCRSGTPGCTAEFVQNYFAALGPTKVRTVVIVSTGTQPAPGGTATRQVQGSVRLVPVSGFQDTLFAGGDPDSPSTGPGTLSIKNNGTVSGSVYAKNLEQDQNNLDVAGDLKVVGDVITKNNSTYRTIWAGGNLSLGQNSVVQQSAKACGAGSSPGNATLNNNSKVTYNLRYEGSLTMGNGSTVGSTTNIGCDAPPVLGLPKFTDNPIATFAGNANWTIIEFTNVADANRCLGYWFTPGIGRAQWDADSVCHLQQYPGAYPTATAGGRLGSASPGGTLMWIHPSTCPAAVNMKSGATFSGNFTLTTNCRIDMGGTLKPAPGVVAQAVFVSKAQIGTMGISIENTLQSQSADLSVLLYSTGQIDAKNSVNLAAGAVYGSDIVIKNSFTVGFAPSLAYDPPPGFTFANSLPVKYVPILDVWKEVGVA